MARNIVNIKKLFDINNIAYYIDKKLSFYQNLFKCWKNLFIVEKIFQQ